MKFKHLMLDLETMSTQSNVAIIAIAAVPFEPLTGEIDECLFYEIINLRHQTLLTAILVAILFSGGIQQEPLDTEEIKINSYKQKIKPINLFHQYCDMKALKDITALDIVEIIDSVKIRGHNRMAQVVRMVLIDIFMNKDLYLNVYIENKELTLKDYWIINQKK